MFRRLGLLAALLVIAACSPSATNTPGTPPPVTGLSLNAVALLAGDSVAPTIMVTAGGDTRPAAANEVVVTSSNTSVIVIGPDHALIAVGDGQSDITITLIATPSLSVTRTVTITSEILSGVRLFGSLSMIPGDSTAIEVTGAIRGGRTVAHPTSVTVVSRNPAVVTLSGSMGIARAIGQGWIVATATTGFADSILVTVAVGAPTRVVVAPESATVVAGLTMHVVVTAISDRRGNAITGVAPTFSSTATAIATVQADGTVTALAAGNAMIIATAGSGVDTLRLSVTPAPLQRLTVVPDSITLRPGDTAHVVVNAFDTQNNVMTPPSLTWTSLTNGITVSSTGLITASSGIVSTIPNGVVRVASGTVTAQLRVAVVFVLPPPVLQRLVASPDSVTLSPGGSAQISVQAIDTHGATMALPPLTWQSLTGGVSVSSNGVVTASSSIGSTISNGAVQLSGGGITTQVRVAVVVVPPPPPPPPPAADNGYVQIRWIGTLPSASVMAAFEAQRARINGVFKSFNGVSITALNIPANYCIAGAPAMNESVPGVIIYAQVAPIDGVGNILGSAGPCLVRNGSLLPVVGSMNFDVADMNNMASNGSLNGVVLHEMMHILGFGTIWGPGGQSEVASPGGADPRYIGVTGQAAYAALGAADFATGVPVENTGGSGTRGSHWRETTFRTELMTGWADGSLPMSRVTIGALKDFGYDVDLNRADPYTLPGSLIGAGLRAGMEIVEQNAGPIGVVGPGGTITPFKGTIVH